MLPDNLSEVAATRVRPGLSCMCGQPYPVQEPIDFHRALAGSNGFITKGALRIRTFCTRKDCGRGFIEVTYPNFVVSL